MLLSIIIQALILPWILHFWTPQGMIGKHVLSLSIKLLLVIPISAASYELIRFAANLPEGISAAALQFPGRALQRLTTREPTREQMEVALVALAEAAYDMDRIIRTEPYSLFSSGQSD